MLRIGCLARGTREGRRCCGLIPNKSKPNHRRWRIFARVAIVLGQVIAITVIFNALGDVLLGNIVGDAWGNYILKKWVGVITTMFTFLIPVVEGIMILS